MTPYYLADILPFWGTGSTRSTERWEAHR